MKTIYLFRHGESTDNIAPVHQSSFSQLTPAGEAQAAVVAGRARSLDFEVLLSSPLPRAKSTAQAISKEKDMPIEIVDIFAERKKPSSIEGKQLDDVDASLVHQQWQSGFFDDDSQVEDGENFSRHLARADAALAYLADRPEENIAVVSHGIFIRTMVGRVLLGEHFDAAAFEHLQSHARAGNTSLTVFQYETELQQWFLYTYGDVAHLAD